MAKAHKIMQCRPNVIKIRKLVFRYRHCPAVTMILAVHV